MGPCARGPYGFRPLWVGLEAFSSEWTVATKGVEGQLRRRVPFRQTYGFLYVLDEDVDLSLDQPTQ